VYTYQFSAIIRIKAQFIVPILFCIGTLALCAGIERFRETIISGSHAQVIEFDEIKYFVLMKN